MPSLLEEAGQAALLAIRQGGEWHFYALAIYASLKLNSKLNSKIEYLFDGTDRNNIVALKQPRGTVHDGLELYKRGVALVYRYIDIARLDKRRLICDAMTTSAVLAEIWSRFERVGTVLISDTLSAALASSVPLKTRDLCQVIRANAVLVLLSSFNHRRPELFPKFLKSTISPVLIAIYNRFKARLDGYRTPILPRLSASPEACLFLHLPADSRRSVPDGVICDTPLPRYLPSISPSSLSSDNTSLRLPDTAFGPVEATAGKRKRPATEEQQEQKTENSKKRHYAEAESKARADEKENITSIPTHTTSQTFSEAEPCGITHLPTHLTAGVARSRSPPLMRYTPYPTATDIERAVAEDVSGILNRPQTEEQRKTKRGAALRQRCAKAQRKMEEKENMA